MASDEAGTVRVAIVDDHQMFADSLARLLADDPDIEVVGTAASADQAIGLARAARPDVVLLDQELPDGTGLDAATSILAEDPTVRVVVITGAVDDGVLQAAMATGCSGFITKDHAASEVARAVRAAAAGEVWLPPALLARLLSHRDRSRRRVGADLSPRELDVLRLLASGASTKAMAEELHLSVNTIRNHVQRVLVKLHAHSKLEAVAIGVREGIVRHPRR